MRLLWWTLIHYDSCPYVKETFGHRDMCTGDSHMKTEAEIGGMRPQAEDCQRSPGNHQKLGERRGTDSPAGPPERTNPADALI